MATAKPKGKKGKKVSGSLEGVNISKGGKKAPASKGEVTGHASSGAWYVCWACGALNYVPYGYDYFICWRDGALNRV
ncbi:MAG TPA: hypothetical protein VLV49_03895 [Terriglobales bacterium]|nr:hypothetical protein [Terriglobales bacterium]